MPLPSIETLLNIGIVLSKEKDSNKLFETILNAAMNITNCDGGTLYVLKDNALHFKIMITKSLGTRIGVDGEDVNLPPVPLSALNVSGRAAVEKKMFNIADVYESVEFNFTNTKKYDAIIGYKTSSLLTIPMEDDYGDVTGVLQLINAMDEDGAVIPFAKEYNHVIFSLASQAAICLTNRNYAAEVTELLDSFVRVMSAAIDARSPYNANHTKNMTKYARRFIEWLTKNNCDSYGLNSLDFSDNIWVRQFYMSVWLHDIGKLVVPLEIMDKESRLGPKLKDIINRFKFFEMRNEIDFLKKSVDISEYERRNLEIKQAKELVETANKAGFITDDMIAGLCEFGKKTAVGADGETPYLTEDELVCLSIRKGTLTDEERGIMENHVTMTRRMLAEMKFPKQYMSVPDWASAHHEFLNGRGYPDRLSGESIPTAVRMLTILDIYDALTARDRPYKPAVPIEKAFNILDSMASDGQIDAMLLALFKQSEAWKEREER